MQKKTLNTKTPYQFKYKINYSYILCERQIIQNQIAGTGYFVH